MKHSIWKRISAFLTSAACCGMFVGQGDYAAFADALSSIDLMSSITAEAGTTVAEGECGAEGDNLTWVLDSEGLLTISGEGEMENGTYIGDVIIPWGDYTQKITKIEIEDGVTSIGDYAFYGCVSWTAITIPDSVTRIGKLAFYGSRATEIYLPDSITSIGNDAFGHSYITSIHLPDNLTHISDSLFCYCSELTAITLPDNLVSIGDEAFNDCNSLTSITIPDTVTSIGTKVFSSCSSITEIQVEEINPNYMDIDGVLFTKDGTELLAYPEGKGDYYEIPDGVTSIGDYAFYYNYSLTDVTIPDSVNHIGDRAFALCYYLTDVFIPDTVASIGDAAFSCPNSLSKIEVADNNTYYMDIDGVLFTKDGAELLCYPAGNTSADSYIIPDHVVTIGDSAFMYCDSLTSIVIPNTVTIIEEKAFSRCDALTSITIPESVTSIGDCVLSMCKDLSEIIIKNPDCAIYSSSDIFPSTATIHGYPGSTAQTYAEKYSRTFVALEEEPVITDEFYLTLDVLGSQAYETVAEIESIESSNSMVAIAVVSEDKMYLSITGVMDGYTEITVKLTNGDIYKVYVTVGNETAATTTTTPITTTTTSTTTTTQSTTTTTSTTSTTSTTTTTTTSTTTTTTSTTTTTTTTSTTTSTTTTTTTTTTTETTTTTTAETRSPAFMTGVDNWGFRNVGKDFTIYNEELKTEVYYLTEEHRDTMLGKLSNKDRDIILEQMNTKHTNGSCYGISVLSMFSAYGILHPSQLQENANFLSDIELTDDIKSVINYHSLLQRTSVITNLITNSLHYEKEEEKVQRLLDSLADGAPTLLCYSESGFTHAVVAYGVDSGVYSYNVNGTATTFNKKILLYDSNAKDDFFGDAYCIYVNTFSNKWYIPYYEIGSSTGGVLLLVEDDTDILRKNSLFGDADSEPSSMQFFPMMEARSTLSEYKIEVVTENNGDWFISASDDDIIIPFSGFMYGEGTAPLCFTMRDNEGSYRLSMTGEPQDMNLQMQYEDCLMRVDAAQAESIVFEPNGLHLEGDGSAYSLHMVLNDTPSATSWHTIDVNGSSADSLRFTYQDGSWILSGDSLRNVQVSANHDTITSDVLTFSTSYDSVCLYQIDEHTIGALVDADGDGTYETPLAQGAETALGDVDGNGTADASDAAEILVAAALLGAGMDSGLTAEQELAADVNGSGDFTADDAATILYYAAAVGSGYDGTLEEFLSA